MSATRATPVSFPGEKTIKKRILEKLLSKRSYVDFSSNVLMLLQGSKVPPSAVHVPEKYSKILHIISYRYDVYRHATAAIQVATCCDTKLATQQLARVLQYLDDVRAAYVARARRSKAEDPAWFSPELEFHLWLDYTERAYHNTAWASIEQRLGVTFEYVLERKEPNISSFIDWKDYIQLHNAQFDMCGLGITLGENETVLQAANDLADAILRDLEATDKRNTGKGKAVANIDDTGDVKQKNTTARSSTTHDKMETRTRAKARKASKEKQQPVVLVETAEPEEGDEDEDNRSGDDTETVVHNCRRKRSEAFDDEDAIILEATNAEENEDCCSSKQTHSRATHHNTSPGNREPTTGADVWNRRFGESYTFIRNRLIEICNTDVNDILDDAALETFHRSIASLENGIVQRLQQALSTIGEDNRQGMAHHAEEKARKARLSALQNVQYDPQRRNDDEVGKIDVVGRVDVDLSDELDMNRPDEMETDLGMQDFLKMIARDTGMAQGLPPELIMEISKNGNHGNDCTPTDAELKRKRGSSVASTSWEDVVSKKTKHPSSTYNPLVSIEMDGIFDLSQ